MRWLQQQHEKNCITHAMLNAHTPVCALWPRNTVDLATLMEGIVVEPQRLSQGEQVKGIPLMSKDSGLVGLCVSLLGRQLRSNEHWVPLALKTCSTVQICDYRLHNGTGNYTKKRLFWTNVHEPYIILMGLQNEQEVTICDLGERYPAFMEHTMPVMSKYEFSPPYFPVEISPLPGMLRGAVKICFDGQCCRESTVMKTCEWCNNAWYCSRKHQKRHWNKHRRVCGLANVRKVG